MPFRVLWLAIARGCCVLCSAMTVATHFHVKARETRPRTYPHTLSKTNRWFSCMLSTLRIKHMVLVASSLFWFTYSSVKPCYIVLNEVLKLHILGTLVTKPHLNSHVAEILSVLILHSHGIETHLKWQLRDRLIWYPVYQLPITSVDDWEPWRLTHHLFIMHRCEATDEIM